MYDTTFILLIPAMVIALITQIYLKSVFSKYKKVNSMMGRTAAEVARMILDDNGLTYVNIERISGDLTDHYDPRSDVIRLSDSVYDSYSVASIGVAAHEVGHAIQHAEEYSPIKIRNSVLPVAQLGSSLAFPLVLLGIIFSWPPLAVAGVVLFVAVLVFQLITLPVEFNASSRALATLDEKGILIGEELSGAKKVLSAAAMTYVAAVITTVLNLLRLIILSRRSN